MIAGSGRSFVDQLGKSPEFASLLATVFPNIDIGSVGGFLQLVFVEFGFILAGLAAATLVASWASDETSGRLEMLLATPLTRRRWVTSGGLGVFVGIVLVTALAVVGVASGAMITGGDIVTPVVGTLSLGLFALAMAGVGIAIGGVLGSGYAAPAVAILTILIWFVDIIAPPLGLPDALHELALTAHFGLPMLGQWDAVGIVASIALGLGGVAIGAWGFGRRDVQG
jgi:ABC-2 type transport system permease protein